MSRVRASSPAPFLENDEFINKSKTELSSTLSFYTVKTGSLQTSAGNVIIGGTEAGSLNINNANDSIAQNAIVMINNNAALNITRGEVTLDNVSGTADTWSGRISLGGDGTLNMNSRLDIDTTDGTKTYNQNGGKLNMKASTLTLGTNASRIIDGQVNLTNASSLTIDNGSTQNQAQVATDGTTVNKLTLNNTNGNPTLKLTGNSEIAKKDQVSLASGSTLEIASTTANGVNLNGGSGADTWDGNVKVAGGILNISENITKTGSLTQIGGAGSTTNVVDNFKITTGDTITAGALNIGDGTTPTILTTECTANIGKNAVVTIEDAAKLAIAGGTVTLDNEAVTADTWKGAIDQTAGELTLDGRDDTTTLTKTYNLSAGTLNIINSGALELVTVDSGMTGGTINLGDTLTTGSLTINNGLNTNSAKVVTNGASTFDVEVGSKFTTATGTNIAQAAVLKVLGELDVAAGDVTVSGNDTWSGTIDVTSNGTLTVLDNLNKTGILNATGGSLVIGDSDSVVADVLNLNNASDVIASNVAVTINTDGKLNQTAGQATLNGTDSWLGAVALGGGTLTLDGRTDTTDATQTYNQTGGTLSMHDSTLTLATAASKITGGGVSLQDDSTLVINNSTSNSAQVVTNDTSANGLTVSGTGTSLQLTGVSEINKEATVTVGSGATLEVNGTSTNGVNLNGGSTSADSWTGDVKVTGGVLNISDNLTKTGTLTQTSGTGTTNIADTFTVADGDSVTAGTLNVGDGAGTDDTTLNVTGGTITAGDGNAKVVINSDATMNITGGTVTLNGGDQGSGNHTQVDWQGTVALGSGGTLILNNIYDVTRSTTELAGNTANKTGLLNATGGNLTINADSVLLGTNDIIADAVTLTLNTANLYVGTGASPENVDVYIGADDTWNGVITLTDSGTLTLDGTTTATGTNSINATGGTLNLVNTGTAGYGSSTGVTFGSTADLIAYGVDTHLSSDLNINAGQVQLDDADTLTSGTITLNGGQLDLAGVSTVNTPLNALTGNLNITTNTATGKTTTLANADTIAKAVVTTIDAGSTLKINNSNANVTLDGTTGSADNWNGALELNAGNLTLDGRTDNLTGTIQTYNQDGGSLTLLDSSLTIANAASAITGGNVALTGSTTSSAGSQLTFDNGLTTNAAVVTSDGNTNNALTVGGTNGATFELKTTSDINKETAVTIESNGILTAYGDSIKGGGTQGITNDGIFNLSDDGATPTATAGTIARAINNAAGDGTTGTVNLTGTTLSTSDGTIDQAYVNVGDGSSAAGSDASTFTMGADVTANTLLTVEQDGKIVNAANDIIAQAIDVKAGGSIVGDGTTEGDLTVKNGGSNAGIISQNDVELQNGILHNTGSLTSNGTFTNAATSTVDNNGTEGAGTLNVFDGSNAGDITQGNMTIAAGNTGFDNDNTITVETKLDNKGTFNNNKDVTVANSTNDANLTNTGIINSNANSTITADTLTNTGGTMNLTKSTVAIVYQSDDIKGIVNILGTDASIDKTDLTITGTTPTFSGTMNIGDVADVAVKSTLNLKSGTVTEAAALSIASGNILNVDDTGAAGTSSVVIDGTSDTYAGDVTLASGAVTMKDLTVTTGDTSTTAGGASPYYAQTGGALTLTNSTLSMADSSLISGGDLTVDKDSVFNSLSNAFSVDNLTNAGLINGINNGYENYAVSTGLYAGDGLADNQGDFAVDLYARSNANKNYDTYGSDSATIFAANGTDGVLNISDWTLHGDLFGYDAPIDRNISMNKLFKGSVAAGQTINFTSTDKEVFTPIGWYKLNSTGGGNYSFDLSKYNSGVFRGQVTKIAQYQNQLMIDDMLFNHTMVDQGFKGNDYIASNPNRLASASDLYPPYQYSRKDGGLWVKMYGTFEKLNMNHGLNVGNNAYGTLIGADFGLKDLRNGWQFMPTAYIGYNGAHQYWNGYGAYQNGGQAGVMGTWYKNNWIIGALAYGGIYNNDMDTPRGNDDTLGYFAGGSVKTAYNWNFAKDWSLQPNLLVAYNFFGKENWHTDFGQMGMMSGMLHGINVAPGVNLIWEKETFSAYATIQYMYNVNQSVGGRAGNVGLPNVHMDRGYLQYGVGVNKKFTDRFSGYLQAVIRNVGRNGIGLQAGFQWQLGKDNSKGQVSKGNVTPELKPAKVVLKGNK